MSISGTRILSAARGNSGPARELRRTLWRIPSRLLLAALDLGPSLRRRLRLYRLLWLDDRMLDDIGVTREELDWALKLPLHTNAALELQARAKAHRNRCRGASRRPRSTPCSSRSANGALELSAIAKLMRGG